MVAGIRTPLACRRNGQVEQEESRRNCSRLRTFWRTHYKDVQDFEFTIEKGKLYMLQTRNGKRTGAAAVKIAVDMVKEKLIDEKTGVLRVDPAGDLDQLLHPTFDPQGRRKRQEPAHHGLAGFAGRGGRQARVHRRGSRRTRRQPASRSFWFAAKPNRPTSAACTSPKAFSPAPAA